MMNAYRTYMETEVSTANSPRLILMLYNGMVRFIKEAKAAISNNHIEEAHNKIIRVSDIVTELRCNLDFSAGELANNLDGLYEYIDYKLSQANMKKSQQELDDALAVIVNIRDAWAQITASQKTDR